MVNMFEIKLSDGEKIIIKSERDAVALADWIGDCCQNYIEFICATQQNDKPIILRVSEISTITEI